VQAKTVNMLDVILRDRIIKYQECMKCCLWGNKILGWNIGEISWKVFSKTKTRRFCPLDKFYLYWLSNL